MEVRKVSVFSERLVAKRIEAGYSQKELAELLEITPTRLNYWEKGKREPDVMFIKKIAVLLKTSGDYLLGTGFDEENVETSLSPESLDLARKYDAIGDEHSRGLIRKVVEYEYEHRPRPNTLPTSEWLFAHAITSPDAEDKARSG